ncbi:GTPase, G3E family [Streptomyces sp. WMMB 322]|nr:GTPase, G3E family [Streptomyces sp. WMMB 322]
MSKCLLTVAVGNSPAVRGAVVDELLSASPDAAVLAVSIQNRDAKYPVVQRLLSGVDPTLRETASLAATGDPVVILRQALLSIRHAARCPHIVLALPEDLDVLPFVVELWGAPVGSSSLADHFAPGPVVVGIDPASSLAEMSCIHRAVRLWKGPEHGDPLTIAEAAARQVEAADILIVSSTSDGSDGPRTAGVASLTRHLNTRALQMPFARAGTPGTQSRPALVCRLPPGAVDERRARLDPVTVPSAHRGVENGVRTVLWRTRRPVHAGRLADALADVMSGVVRSRGHLWLSSRPDAVVTWHSAGAHLELREAGGWLEAEDDRAWEAAPPQRRALASWFWHDYYGERRNEIAFTGVDLDERRIQAVLDAVLLTDEELAQGREFWASVPDPLLGGTDPT